MLAAFLYHTLWVFLSHKSHSGLAILYSETPWPNIHGVGDISPSGNMKSATSDQDGKALPAEISPKNITDTIKLPVLWTAFSSTKFRGTGMVAKLCYCHAYAMIAGNTTT